MTEAIHEVFGWIRKNLNRVSLDWCVEHDKEDIMTVKKLLTVEVNMTPEELASMFYNMSPEDKAMFFNELVWIANDKGDEQRFAHTLEVMIQGSHLRQAARSMIRRMGDVIKEHEINQSK